MSVYETYSEENKISRRKANRKWNEANKEQKKTIWLKCIKRQKKWFDELKSTYYCIKCGENNPLCLDFHHRDPVEKKYELAYMGVRGYSKEKILAEIDKCDVLCANCHRKNHVTD